MKKVLTICKPSYNRFDVLIPDVKEYLSLNDERLYVKVNDNGSTDPGIELLKNINHPNFSYQINEKNEGPIPNFIKALSNATSDYIMLLLDKDTVDVKLLPNFLDYLESTKPYFGYIDLSNNKQKQEVTYKAGIDAITHVGYLRKHPSGYFWRTDLFYNEMSMHYFKDMDPSFDFPFGAICGSLASKYDATVIYWPLIINANMRKFSNPIYKKTYSYNDDNFYFGKRLSLMAYNYFLKNLLSLDIPQNDKDKIVLSLTNSAVVWCTTALRRILQRKNVCEYYNLTMRDVSFLEMYSNTTDVLQLFKTITKGFLSYYRVFYFIIIVRLKSLLRTLRVCIKDVFIKPKEEPITA